MSSECYGYICICQATSMLVNRPKHNDECNQTGFRDSNCGRCLNVYVWPLHETNLCGTDPKIENTTVNDRTALITSLLFLMGLSSSSRLHKIKKGKLKAGCMASLCDWGSWLADVYVLGRKTIRYMSEDIVKILPSLRSFTTHILNWDCNEQLALQIPHHCHQTTMSNTCNSKTGISFVTMVYNTGWFYQGRSRNYQIVMGWITRFLCNFGEPSSRDGKKINLIFMDLKI